MIEQRKLRWMQLWARLRADGNPHGIYTELVHAYRRPTRHYHTLEHIDDCLDELDQVRSLAVHPDELEFSFWFHDGIYDSRVKDHEDQSAIWAMQVATSIGLPVDSTTRIGAHIRASTHDVVPVDLDTQLFVDIDLAILGQAPTRFDEYERQIRAEYAWVPDRDFVAGRSAILRSFLGRPRIYATDIFAQKYEAPARQNLERSIARLQHRL